MNTDLEQFVNTLKPYKTDGQDNNEQVLFWSDATHQQSSLSTEQIVKGLQKGDESALEYVYSRYSKDLFRFGYQYTKDKDLIMDCIHDVFLNLLNKKRLLGKIESIKSYLFTSLYHRIIYCLKREKKQSLKNEENQGFEIEFNTETKLILEEHYKEKLQKVKTAINNLSKKQRQAILHYYHDGFTQKEIAKIMELQSANSVAKLIARGLKILREHASTIIILMCLSL